LGHIGGLGTRSRRGFGTLALKDLEVVEGSKNEWSELEQLVPAHSTTTADDWLNRFESGLDDLREWFTPVHTPVTRTVLGSDTRFYLFREGCETEKKAWQERNGQRRTET